MIVLILDRVNYMMGTSYMIGTSKLPLKTLFVGALTLILSACGGEPLTFNGNPASSSSELSSTADVSSSSESTSESGGSESSSSVSTPSVSAGSLSSTSGSSTSSRSSASSSSSRSSVASSASGPTGAQLYKTMTCESCHGVNGAGGSWGNLLSCSKCSDLAELTNIIDTTMPLGNPGLCDLECSQKLAQLIFNNFAAVSLDSLPSFLKQTGATTPEFSLLANTDSSCGVAYSQNDLRLLTRQEYSNAVLKLTGLDIANSFGQSTFDALPVDNLNHSYHTSENLNLDSDTQNAYQAVADKVTAQLSAQDFAGLVNCSQGDAECYREFVEQFGCDAFRRPLTSEEQASYAALYNAQNLNGALTKAVTAILSSPQFVYRSNIGLALDDGSTVASAPNLLAAPQTLGIYEQHSVSAGFTGNDILEITVKASQNSNGLWPTLRVQVGQSTFVDIGITNDAINTYRFHVTALTGNTNVILINQQTGAALEYQSGHNLTVSALKLSSSN